MYTDRTPCLIHQTCSKYNVAMRTTSGRGQFACLLSRVFGLIVIDLVLIVIIQDGVCETARR